MAIAPDNQARGRCNGTQAVLRVLFPLAWLDHGWGALAFKQKAPAPSGCTWLCAETRREALAVYGIIRAIGWVIGGLLS